MAAGITGITGVTAISLLYTGRMNSFQEGGDIYIL